AYRDALSAGRLPVDGEERVEGAAHRLEEIWLKLRTDQGVALQQLDAAGRAEVERWCSTGWATMGDDTARLTAEGWLLLDRLAVKLDEAAAERASSRIDLLAGPVQIAGTSQE